MPEAGKMARPSLIHARKGGEGNGGRQVIHPGASPGWVEASQSSGTTDWTVVCVRAVLSWALLWARARGNEGERERASSRGIRTH